MVRRTPSDVSGARFQGRVLLGALASTAATTIALAALVVATGLAPSSPVSGSGEPFALMVPAIPLLFLLIAGCWLVVDDHPRAAVGLSLIAVAWLLPALAAWPLLTAQVRAALLSAAPLAAAGIALLTGGWRPLVASGRTPLFAAVGLASAAAAVHLFGYDPFFDPACQRTCEAASPALSSVLGSRQALGFSAAFTSAASTAAALVSLRSRTTPAGLRAAGASAAIAVATAAIVPWWRWGSTRPGVGEDVLQSSGVVAIVLAVLTAALHTRFVRRSVRDVVEHLAGSGSLGRASASVTEVHFAVPEDGRWVDAAGRRVTTGAPGRCVVLSDHVGPSVRLVLSRWAEPAHVRAMITPAGRLVLENGRLLAAARARLVQVHTSQRRIVETTDLERRRIERDLHDGAQQRLVAVMMCLSSGAKRFPAISDTLGGAEVDVRHALAALRDLSHDFLPAVLGAEGLEAAVEDVAATTPVRVELDLAVAERPLAPAVQTAAYFAVVAGLKNVVTHARTDNARVTLTLDGQVLVVTVTDRGAGGAAVGRGLTDVADRIGALGGSLELTSVDGEGTTMSVRVPCGS